LRRSAVVALAGLAVLFSSSACDPDGGNDSTGQMVWRGLQTPCGVQIPSTVNHLDHDPSYLFTGYEKDDALAMLDAGARFYNPTFCQFASVDPVTQVGRSSYAYAANNPLKYVDPDGRQEHLKNGEPLWWIQLKLEWKNLQNNLARLIGRLPNPEINTVSEMHGPVLHFWKGNFPPSMSPLPAADELLYRSGKIINSQPAPGPSASQIAQVAASAQLAASLAKHVLPQGENKEGWQPLEWRRRGTMGDFDYGGRRVLTKNDAGQWITMDPTTGQQEIAKGSMQYARIGDVIYVGNKGHTSLTQREHAWYAGDILFDEEGDGSLLRWDNRAGHYMSPATRAHQAGLPMKDPKSDKDLFIAEYKW